MSRVLGDFIHLFVQRASSVMVKYKMMVTNETIIPPLLLKRDESENPKVANRSGSCWEGGIKNSFPQIQLTGMMSKLAISVNF